VTTDRAAPALAWEPRGARWWVVAITVLVFAPTLALGRVALDDDWLWADDSPLRAPSAAALRHVWLELDARARHDIGTEYLPVRDTLVAIDMALWGDRDAGFHATQLALYALTAFGLGTLLVRFGLRRDLAWLATLFWALHPLHVESIAWLSERKGILAGLFVVACGHAWIRYRTGGRRRWLALGALAAIAATWSKAPAMFAPAVFAAWDLLVLPPRRRGERFDAAAFSAGAHVGAWPGRETAEDAPASVAPSTSPSGSASSGSASSGSASPGSASSGSASSGSVPFGLPLSEPSPAGHRWTAIVAIGSAAVLAAVPVVLVARSAGVIDSAIEAAPDGRLVSALGAQGHYIASLALALAPSISYPIQTAGAGVTDLALGALAVLASLALACFPRGPGRPWRRAVLAWTWIWFLPISHLLVQVHIAVADRFAYLWCLGGCAGAAWLVLQLRGAARLAATAALVLLLGIASLRAEAAWSSSIALFSRALAASPGDPVACQRLAGELAGDGDRAAALGVLARGLAVHPDHPYLLADQARQLDALGRHADALAASAHAAQSGHASTLALHAELLARAGRAAEAVAFAERAARRRPETPAYAQRWIDLLLAARRTTDAEAAARDVAAHDISGASQLLLAHALIAAGKPAEALPHLALATALGAPADAVATVRSDVFNGAR
jgi:tetratricopeptide (TPR) repeat protein